MIMRSSAPPTTRAGRVIAGRTSAAPTGNPEEEAMKTSVIDVPDMLSVLTVDEVEARFEEVPGVESATVNFAARKVTVRAGFCCHSRAECSHRRRPG